MRVDFTTIWIFRGWIPHLIVTLYTEAALSRPSCTQNQYLKLGRCCSKCGPGTYAFAQCTNGADTKCRPCGSKEYQPYWNNETKCLPQKFCDQEKGFLPNPGENHTALVPCLCRPGTHCSLINCEYCERIDNCTVGKGLAMDKQSGRGSCVPCKQGYFSSSPSAEPCKPWTNCKALGKTEKYPGSDKTDSVCGPLIIGISPLWIVVAVLSSLVLICLVILSLFCYMEKLTPFSENLRTCVLNLKRTRIQQEASCISSQEPQNCTLLYEEESHNATSSCPSNTVAREDPAASGADQPGVATGTCAEFSEGEPPPTSGSCSCVLSARGPLEVGENEDCSQAVATGSCSCGLDSSRELPSSENLPTSPPDHLGSCDLFLDLSSRTTRGALSGREGDLSCSSPVEGDCRENEPCCCSIDSTVAPLLSVDRTGELNSRDKLPVSKPSHDPGLDLSGQSSDTPVASGYVSGNNNTTFISNGQVMNFSGDVIVVYVSQGSQGGEEAQDEAFSSPVQEESSMEGGRGPAKVEAVRAPWENTTPVQQGLQNQQPVQEERNDWPQHKLR